MPSVRYTRRALARLKYIGEWIAKDNPAAAQRVIATISDTIDLLGDQSEMGRQGRIDGTRELVVSGVPYIVAYRIKTSGVEIVTILHASQRWPDRL